MKATASKTAGDAGTDAAATTTADQASAGATGTATEGERKPLPVPEGGWPPDEFTGVAGNFIRDPYTGIRTRAPAPVEDQPADPAASAEA